MGYGEKMHNLGKISCAIILICLLTTAVYPTTTATRKIGIGPARINFPEVLRNSDYRITVFIYNGNDYEMNASLGISGEVKDWITFFNKNDTENPIASLLLRNESTTSVVMQLTVPENVSNGHYTGEIYAEMQPLKIEV